MKLHSSLVTLVLLAMLFSSCHKTQDAKLNYFPLTEHTNLTGSAFGQTYNEWKTNKSLEGTDHIWREHIPEFVELKEAQLTFKRDARVVVKFPRYTGEMEVKKGQSMDVSEWIGIGRHTYQITSLEDVDVQFDFKVTVLRPIVETKDEAYIISAKNIGYSQRHWLEDDRAQQRVGRTELFVKTLPQDYSTTTVSQKIDLNGTWKYKKVEGLNIEDYSYTWLDDSAWDAVSVPHKWETEFPEWKGQMWYRKTVDVPQDWSGQKVLLRFSGIDDQPRIYVNGQEVGYNCGWHRAFQLDISEHLRAGEANIIAMHVSRRDPKASTWVYDGGMVYGFIKDFILSGYPLKTEYLGGIFGSTNEMAIVENTGSVLFEPRVHPYLEGLLQFSFEAGKQPLSFGDRTTLSYRPPIMSYHNVKTGAAQDATVKTITGYEQDVILIEGSIPTEKEVTVRVRVRPFKIGENQKVTLSKLPTGVAVRLGDGTVYGEIHALKNQIKAIEIQENMNAPYHQQEKVILLKLILDSEKSFQVGVFTNKETAQTKDWLAANDDAFGQLTQTWDDKIFSYTTPLRAEEGAAASYRTYKQTLTLDAKDVDGEIKGLFTSLIKYPVFWLRDGSISVPGAMYGGERSNKIAVNFAGEVYDAARQNIDNVILNPDGSFTPGRRASDAATLSIYAIYKVWCQEGDDWLQAHYESVLTYLNHAVKVDQYLGDPADGIIRSSDGDWYDSAYKLKYLRKGASLFVQVNYLRALKYGVPMAKAMGDEANAKLWQELLEKGSKNFVKPIQDGGYYLPEQGYLADAIMKLDSLGGWKYPDDLSNVSVFAGFRAMPHSTALIEGFITDKNLKANILKCIDNYNILRPVPGLTQYPFSDFMKAEGMTGEYETTPFNYNWKILPGNQAAGGRWPFVGGIIENALWSVGATQLAEEANTNLAGYLKSAWQPARPTEDIHASGLFRNEAGSPIDTEGFYFLWGSATPLEALVEGKYGIRPVPNGFSLDPKNCGVGDGINKIAIRKGTISYQRVAENTFEITLAQPVDGFIYFKVPANFQASNVSVSKSISGEYAALPDLKVREGEVVIPFEQEWTSVKISF